MDLFEYMRAANQEKESPLAARMRAPRISRVPKYASLNHSAESSAPGSLSLTFGRPGPFRMLGFCARHSFFTQKTC